MSNPAVALSCVALTGASSRFLHSDRLTGGVFAGGGMS